MARRRRGRLKYINPDMGWWVDQGRMSFIQPQPNGTAPPGGTAESLIQFNDITDDDSLILRDNSDWFVKRVILEAWPRLFLEEPNFSTNINRLYTLSVGTIDNDKLAEWVVNLPHTLFEPGGYEMWSRMFRTYNRNVSQHFSPKIAVDSAATGSLATTTSSAENFQFREVAPWWGPESVIDDFTVSNAGLKPEQSLAIACSILDPSGVTWGAGDTLQVDYTIRVLLQKRRAA